MSETIDLSILIPVYNGEDTIAEVLSRTETVVDELGLTYEFVLVDDRSGDGSWTILESLARRSSHIRAIRLLRNYGQHNALLAGIRAARGANIVTLDDDLQHPPEEIPRLLDQMRETGADVVYGTPEKMPHSAFRNSTSWLLKIALRSAMGNEIARHVSAFRLFRTHLRDAFANYDSPWVSIDVLLTWGTTRMSAVPVRHEPRKVGASNYTLGRLFGLALTMLTGFSTIPLRIASFVGLGFTLLGGVVLLYVFGIYLIHGRVVPGFAFLAAIITVFAGAQLFALGIIGEYLARVHLRSMGKPPYSIDQTVIGSPD